MQKQSLCFKTFYRDLGEDVKKQREDCHQNTKTLPSIPLT